MTNIVFYHKLWALHMEQATTQCVAELTSRGSSSLGLILDALSWVPIRFFIVCLCVCVSYSAFQFVEAYATTASWLEC